MEESGRPVDESWIAAVHASEQDFTVLGAAVVLDRHRLLTCAHVVAGREEIWIAFPKADHLVGRRRVTELRVAAQPVADLAVLVLGEPVPEGVTPARLKCPRPGDLEGRRWYAFGFGGGDPLGNAAHGTIGGSLGYGWIRLDTLSSYKLEQGFSGTGLWSPDYGAVIGVVGQANQPGDGRALALSFADGFLPGEGLRSLTAWSAGQAGDAALTAWGWRLREDPQATAHWRPRARGVTVDSEGGFRFRGRRAALTAIVNWLERPETTRKALVVTGMPGVGKSAVLGRIVTTADPEISALLPAGDTVVSAPLGSVSCAVHAKGKTAMEVATEIARAASARLPAELGDLPPALNDVLSELDGATRFNVVIDALDEVTSAAEARAIIKQIVVPLVETCARTGVQVVVGTRRHDDGGDLLLHFGQAKSEIDLDKAEYFELDDLAAYAEATLQLLGDERSDNPYNDPAVAAPVARRIAELADRNFLVAGLVSRAHGMHDERAIAPADISFTPRVEDALRKYLERIPPAGDLDAGQILTALAFARPPGFTAELWRHAINALYEPELTAETLTRFIRSSAANFLVESGGEPSAPSYRLFHQALNDTLLDDRQGVSLPEEDEAALTRTFAELGRTTNWAAAPAYLLRSLPGHAVAAQLIDEVLTDDTYVLHADLSHLIPLAKHAVSSAGRGRTRLLQLTPRAVTASPAERVSLFSLTEALEGLEYAFSRHPAPPGQVAYRALWASSTPRRELAPLEGHGQRVRSLCGIRRAGRTDMVASADGREVRVWDLETGQSSLVLTSEGPAPRSVCAFLDDGRTRLAVGLGSGEVIIVDLESGARIRTLSGHDGAVNAVCALTVHDQLILATAGHEGKIGLWNLTTGGNTFLSGHRHEVNALCEHSGVLVSGGGDGTLRSWDPLTGTPLQVLRRHSGPVNDLCTMTTAEGRELVVSAGGDDTVALWESNAAGDLVFSRALSGHTFAVRGVCSFTWKDQALLASAGDDTVRLWDVGTAMAREVGRHDGHVWSVCQVEVDGRPVLASGGTDGTVRLWDIDVAADRPAREPMGAERVATVNWPAGAAVVTGDGDELTIWSPATGAMTYTGSVDENPIVHSEAVTCHLFRDVPRTYLFVATTRGFYLLPSDDEGEVRIDPVSSRYVEVTACAVTPFHGGALISYVAGHIVRAIHLSPAFLRELEVYPNRVPFDLTNVPLTTTVRNVQAMCAVGGMSGDLRLFTVNDTQIESWIVTERWFNDVAERWLEDEVGTDVRFEHPIDHSLSRTRTISDLTAMKVGDVFMLLAVTQGRHIELWRIPSGEGYRGQDYSLVATLSGGAGDITSLYPFTAGRRTMLAAVGDDRIVQIWDVASRTSVMTIPFPHRICSVSFSEGILYVGLSAGVVAVQLSPEALRV
ncbi:trypsin-like peptidase domain-containing protein [Actinomadura fulvescens]|uniref:Orc1-like AAA ATPase domain-containing protein n=1 Tax=Actinomadura fulvescens TaxID=46160 RepID=A0ABP6CNK8_9ACTN